MTHMVTYIWRLMALALRPAPVFGALVWHREGLLPGLAVGCAIFAVSLQAKNIILIGWSLNQVYGVRRFMSDKVRSNVKIRSIDQDEVEKWLGSEVVSLLPKMSIGELYARLGLMDPNKAMPVLWIERRFNAPPFDSDWKAFINVFSTSVVCVTEIGSQIQAFQKFRLLHEIAHLVLGPSESRLQRLCQHGQKACLPIAFALLQSHSTWWLVAPAAYVITLAWRFERNEFESEVKADLFALSVLTAQERQEAAEQMKILWSDERLKLRPEHEANMFRARLELVTSNASNERMWRLLGHESGVPLKIRVRGLGAAGDPSAGVGLILSTVILYWCLFQSPIEFSWTIIVAAFFAWIILGTGGNSLTQALQDESLKLQHSIDDMLRRNQPKLT